MKFTCHVHKVLIVIKIIVKQSPWQKRVPKLLLHLVGNMRVTGPNLGSWGNPLPSCHKQTKYYKRISSKDPKWVFNDQIHWTIKVIEKPKKVFRNNETKVFESQKLKNNASEKISE